MNHQDMSELRPQSRKLFGALLAATTLGMLITPAVSAQQGWEYTDEGWNQEEWYDPTDWFDDEFQGFDEQGYESYWDDDLWQDEVASSNRNTGYYGDYYYDWNNDSNQWERQQNQSSSRQEARYDYEPDYVIYTFTTTDGQRRQDSQSMRNNRNRGQFDQSQGNQENRDQTRTKRLQGEIRGFRQMELKTRDGGRDNFTVVKLQMDNGQSTVVSLGRAGELQNLDLEQGDQVQLLGTPGMIDNQPVFVARKLRVNNKSVDVNKAIRRENVHHASYDRNSRRDRSGYNRNSNDSSRNRSGDYNRSSSGSENSGWKQSTSAYNPEDWGDNTSRNSDSRSNRNRNQQASSNSRDYNRSYSYNSGQNSWEGENNSSGSEGNDRSNRSRSSGSQGSGSMTSYTYDSADGEWNYDQQDGYNATNHNSQNRTASRVRSMQNQDSNARSSRNDGSSSRMAYYEGNYPSQDRDDYNSTRQGDQMDQVTLRGRVEDFHKVTVSRNGGDSEQRTVVRIRLENGESALVNLGSDTSLSDLDLQRDDRVMIRGEREQWGDRSVVQAERIRVEGETIQSAS